MSNPNITVILQTYLRPENLNVQKERVQRQSIEPHQIITIHVNSRKSPLFGKADIDVVFNQDNKVMGKFIAAGMAKADTDFIAILSDNVIPGRRWLECCYRSYQNRTGLYGSAGFNVVNSKNLPRQQPAIETHFWDDRTFRQREHTEAFNAVGKTWFFPRNWLQIIFSERPSSDVTAGRDDIWVSYLLDQHGIPSLVAPHPQKEKDLWGCVRENNCDVPHYSDRYDGYRKDRSKLAKEAVRKGWDLSLEVFDTKKDPCL